MERERVQVDFNISRLGVGNEYASGRSGWKELAIGGRDVANGVATMASMDALPTAFQ